MKLHDDIFTEPNVDPDTLANLGPLRPLAGSWMGSKGIDINPKANGPERDAYIERIIFEPIDGQTNGPQLFYGLRYWRHINQPDVAITFHDQVGYWLWEPATGLIQQSLTIPRGQIVLASGYAKPDDKSFKLSAKRGLTDYGICSTDFLEKSFRTESYELTVTIHDDDTYSYDQFSMLTVTGEKDPFEHHDVNTLKRVGQPQPNPYLVVARKKEN